MMDRIIDYPHLIQNIDEMINTLEYDSSRSGGKTKLNCDKLVNLYSLKERYSKVIEKKNSKKPTKEFNATTRTWNKKEVS